MGELSHLSNERGNEALCKRCEVGEAAFEAARFCLDLLSELSPTQRAQVEQIANLPTTKERIDLLFSMYGWQIDQMTTSWMNMVKPLAESTQRVIKEVDGDTAKAFTGVLAAVSLAIGEPPPDQLDMTRLKMFIAALITYMGQQHYQATKEMTV